jgi:hypothetical protein
VLRKEQNLKLMAAQFVQLATTVHLAPNTLCFPHVLPALIVLKVLIKLLALQVLQGPIFLVRLWVTAHRVLQVLRAVLVTLRVARLAVMATIAQVVFQLQAFHAQLEHTAVVKQARLIPTSVWFVQLVTIVPKVLIRQHLLQSVITQLCRGLIQ